LLIALVGAGVPLGQRVIPGKWVAPVIDAVVLPAHAATSTLYPVGTYATPTVTGFHNPGTSPVTNLAERTEQEILDFFVGKAEAASSCPTNYCNSGNVQIDLVATITRNPSESECIQAKVTIYPTATCYQTCQFFEFTARVDGNTVQINESCDLSLHDMTLTAAGLEGNWSYSPIASSGGTFSAPASSSGGCGSLSGCPV